MLLTLTVLSVITFGVICLLFMSSGWVEKVVSIGTAVVAISYIFAYLTHTYPLWLVFISTLAALSFTICWSARNWFNIMIRLHFLILTTVGLFVMAHMIIP